MSAELDPLLGLLAAAEAECGRRIAEAQQEASRIMAEARESAAGIAADARRQAEEARTAAAEGILAAARAQAEETERAAAARTAARPGLREDDVRALVLAAIELVRTMPDEGGDQ